MDLKLFRALEVVLRAYSRQSPKKLIDQYLRVRIILRVPVGALQKLGTSICLSPPEQAVFLNSKNREGGFKRPALLIVDHPLSLPLSAALMSQLQDCIVINEGGNCSNVLGINKGKDSLPTRAVLFKFAHTEFQELTQHLDAYLSVCELFMGHIHLTFSCFQSETEIDLSQEIAPVIGDEFADFREHGYFRVLQQRASRITLEQLSDTCRIERQSWGEILVFQGGQQCLIVWLTLKRLPLLGTIPSVRFNKKRSKMLPLMMESNLGFKIFKQRQCLKAELEQLETTTIIFNLSTYDENVKGDIEQLFEKEAEKFFSLGAIEKDTFVLHESILNCERICQILDVPAIELIKKLMRA